MRRWLLYSGLLMVALTGIFNVGIIAMDDYFDVISKIIPAQMTSFAEILDSRGIHSPLPALILAWVAKLPLKLGFLQPLDQLRFVLVMIGVVSYIIQATVGLTVFKKDNSELKVFLFLVGFHFMAPLFFSRAMVETLSVPWVSLSAFFCWRYFQTNKKQELLLCSLFALVAFQLRYQTLAIAPGIILSLLLRKKFKGLIVFAAALGVGILCCGGFEQFLTGQFFGIAKPYFEYNLHYSSGHGVTPFYTFVLLFLGLSIFPFFISNYKMFHWGRYRELSPFLLPFVSFLILHSLIPHKEERFMIPVLGLFFLLLTPIATYQTHVKWRKWGFVAVNSLLLFPASFSAPQRNSILLVDYLSRHSKFDQVISVNDGLVMFPEAYGLRKLKKIELKDSDLNKIQLQCSDAVVVRKDNLDKLKPITYALDNPMEFKPGFLEAALVKLNPKQNARRGSLLLFQKKGCG